MKIKTRTSLLAISLVIFSVALTAGLSAYTTLQREEKEVQEFRAREIAQAQQKLKNLVDIAHTTVENNMKQAADPRYLESRYGSGIYVDEALEEAQRKSMADVKSMRYDDGTGYFWIQDTGRPFPRVLMHPVSPALDGTLMNGPEFNSALGRNENLGKALVDAATKDGAGFVDYRWNKPMPDGSLRPAMPKLSYVRLFEPLQWIIGTGIYIDNIDAAVADKRAALREHFSHLTGIIFLSSLFVILAGVAASFWLSGAISAPIEKLIGSIQEITRSGLPKDRITLNGIEEINRLGSLFNRMLDSIQTKTGELNLATAAKERMESELEIARRIQLGILPTVFPAFPEKPEFDILATIVPARVVGGDLYDFFLLDEDRLCFVIGDVSDKGVPAAFFMAVTKTLLKATASAGGTPAQILDRVNRELCHENEACMFVTLFVAILNMRTGDVIYSDGGHNPPLLIREDGETRFLGGKRGTAGGVFLDIAYRDERLELSAGDTLLLYTDGVTECMNERAELFSEERLLVEGQKAAGRPLGEFLKGLMDSLKGFAGEADQHDDITLLVLQYLGPSVRDPKAARELTIRSRLSEWPKVQEWVARISQEHHLPAPAAGDLLLALEEIVTNVMKYAYDPREDHRIELSAKFEGPEVRLAIADDGHPFNPLDHPPQAFADSIDQLEIGGHGLNLVRQIMDGLSYERRGELNILTLVKRWG